MRDLNPTISMRNGNSIRDFKHIWKQKNGTYCINIMLHIGPMKQRIRTSLKTKDLATALARRDETISRYRSKSVPVTEKSADQHVTTQEGVVYAGMQGDDRGYVLQGSEDTANGRSGLRIPDRVMGAVRSMDTLVVLKTRIQTSDL